MPVRRTLLAGALFVSQSWGAAAEAPSPSGLFQFGGTGIRCVREPCPHIGVMRIDGGGERRRGWPVYSGPRPPALSGSPDDRAAVERAWTVGGCLKVEGAFVQPAEFEIRRVVGGCGR